MTFTGKFRIHFNRHNAAPNVWCVTPATETPSWELATSRVTINVPVITIYRQKAEADDEDGLPSAWLETPNTSVLRLVNSTASIDPYSLDKPHAPAPN